MQNPQGPAVVLASSSRWRRELLARVLDDFESVSPAVDETPGPGEAPQEVVRRLAREKAEAVGRARPGALAIGADQLAVLDARILGKPGTPAAALEQLMAVAGHDVRFLTAACVHDPSGRLHEHTDVTVVRFRRFGRELATRYLEHDRPYDCAGSFRVEGAGVVLFESVQTVDPTALVGLPMIWLAGELLALGCLAGPPLPA